MKPGSETLQLELKFLSLNKSKTRMNNKKKLNLCLANKCIKVRGRTALIVSKIRICIQFPYKSVKCRADFGNIKFGSMTSEHKTLFNVPFELQ